MHVAVLKIELSIPGARSLKDRRQVVKSLKERIQHRFNVSISEVGEVESWVRATLAVTACAGDQDYLRGQMDELIRYAQNDAGAAVGNVERDYIEYR